MGRNDFERVTPESVGIPSSAIENLLDKLENGVTEMHGLMIMRHDKICAEGWWAPYGPGIRHGLQSLSKTYSATAVGIACTEGILHLDEAIIDIFPEQAPDTQSDFLRRLRVRDVLCMGSGMKTMPEATKDWIRDFLATEIEYEPGTAFMYNSVGSTLLCAMVEARSGETMAEYLKSRLFDKIGIDSNNTMWEYMPDGTSYGGGGFYATTEDNLRLMKLYKDGGRWNGEQILSEDYVKQAISKQINTATEAEGNPEASDNFLGYGFQIWMCSPEDVYRADGAMGQFSIVCPKQDMIISINETATGAHWAQNTLNVVWEFLKEISENETVVRLADIPNEMAGERLKRRMRHLAIESPEFIQAHQYKVESRIHNVPYQVVSGRFGFETEIENSHSGQKNLLGIESFRLQFEQHQCRMIFKQMEQIHTVEIALDGSRRWNRLKLPGRGASEVYLSGTWTSEMCFEVHARWIETCYENCLKFYCDGDHITITKSNTVGRYRAQNELRAEAIKEDSTIWER